jgi:phosphatidylglycerophosphate synthase
MLDLLLLTRRKRRFSYLKARDAWSTVLFVDWLAILIVELSIRLFRGKLFPDQFTALSVFFFFLGLTWLYVFSTPYVPMVAFYLSITMDCVDGKLARALALKTRHGGVVDALADCLVHGLGYILLGMWVYKQTASWGALVVIGFAGYMVVAHVNDVMVHLGLKGRAQLLPGRSTFWSNFLERRGLNTNPIGIVDLNFVGVPFLFLYYASTPAIFPLLLATSVVVGIGSGAKKRRQGT